MRVFAIADASKRRARPIALLAWKADETHEQGRFALELSSTCDEDELPLSLSFCVREKGRRATPERSEAWVKSRIVPEDRHNIAEVLQANGLARYDEVGLFAASMGRSSDDDYLAYELHVPDGLAEEVAEAIEQGGSVQADRILGALEQQHASAEVRYAFVGIPGDTSGGASSSAQPEVSAAKRIGAQIRARRKAAGLTQRQLAARAGITQTVLSRAESGTGNPTLALLESIAAALGERLDVSLGA